MKKSIEYFKDQELLHGIVDDFEVIEPSDLENVKGGAKSFWHQASLILDQIR
jgi:hypothetical protein